MAIAQPLKAGNKNAVNIYDPSFDPNLEYQAKLTNKFFCDVITVVDIGGVSFCENLAGFTFVLPCMSPGAYKLEFINKSDSSAVYELAANVY